MTDNGHKNTFFFYWWNHWMCRHGFNLFINVNTFYIQISRLAGNPSPSHLFMVPETLSLSSILSHIEFSQDYYVAIFFLVKMILNCSCSCFWVVCGIHYFYFFSFTHCYLSLTSTGRVPWGSAWHILPTSSDVVKARPATYTVRQSWPPVGLAAPNRKGIHEICEQRNSSHVDHEGEAVPETCFLEP